MLKRGEFSQNASFLVRFGEAVKPGNVLNRPGSWRHCGVVKQNDFFLVLIVLRALRQ